MIKAIFFDVDGTLFSHTTGIISKSTHLALDELKKRNIKSIIATGRHMLELQDMPVISMDFDGYITLNGQLCLDENKKLFYGNPVNGVEKEYLIRLFQEKKIPIMFIEENRMYINFVNKMVKEAQADILTAVPHVGVYSGGDIYMAVAYIQKDEEVDFREQLPGCKITRWNNKAVDIISANGGKINGIKQYLLQNDWKIEEVMAFGDAENDVEMLGFAGIGVAMGNAVDYVKEHADYVTTGVDEDGVEYALKHYGII